mmetsp:Transcript_44868/g.116231  ORF Transcript_44868/g.116231 Transcript_44868/m.116231 type:complete len:389 (+) Transcript_44868:71-1237(+)
MADVVPVAGALRSRGFAVVRKLTSTGTCSVYSVARNDAGNGELFAAKVVKLTGLDAMGRAAAQQEVSFLKGLEPHLNLIGYCDSFLDDPRLVIVMSLAEDGDLRSVVKESAEAQKAIPEPVVLAWMRQALAGLSHLHSQSVLHRDLKSSNVFLSRGRRHLQIGDFGISRMLESTSFAESQVGTPAYMSPELMEHQRYDFHADMWAMGVICYELCMLRVPFPASSLLELFAQVTEMEPDWDKWAGCSEELRTITARLLQKEAQLRPTAAELLGEPLFAEEVNQEVPEELWAAVAPAEVAKKAPEILLDKSKLPGSESTSPCSTTAGSTLQYRLQPVSPGSTMAGSSYADPNSPTDMSPHRAFSLNLEDFKKMVSSDVLGEEVENLQNGA